MTTEDIRSAASQRHAETRGRHNAIARLIARECVLTGRTIRVTSDDPRIDDAINTLIRDHTIEIEEATR